MSQNSLDLQLCTASSLGELHRSFELLEDILSNIETKIVVLFLPVHSVVQRLCVNFCNGPSYSSTDKKLSAVAQLDCRFITEVNSEWAVRCASECEHSRQKPNKKTLFTKTIAGKIETV